MDKGESKVAVSSDFIEQSIYIVRGHKVMLDKDLAVLYGIETRNLNKAVNRNSERFPKDFMFPLNKEEWANLMFQFGTSSSEWGGRRKLPTVFTEQGVAMLSSVLRSKQAIEVNIEIMRTFTKLRYFLAEHKETRKEMTEIKAFILKHSHANDKEFKRVWQAIEKLGNTSGKNRTIGFDLN